MLVCNSPASLMTLRVMGDCGGEVIRMPAVPHTADDLAASRKSAEAGQECLFAGSARAHDHVEVFIGCRKNEVAHEKIVCPFVDLVLVLTGRVA